MRVGLIARLVLREDLLAGERRVASTATGRVTAYIAVGVSDIVFVFFVEFIVCFFGERRAPEMDTFVEAEADAFEEKSVL